MCICIASDVEYISGETEFGFEIRLRFSLYGERDRKIHDMVMSSKMCAGWK